MHKDKSKVAHVGSAITCGHLCPELKVCTVLRANRQLKEGFKMSAIFGDIYIFFLSLKNKKKKRMELKKKREEAICIFVYI